MTKKIKDYSPEELAVMRQTAIKASAFGFSAKQCAELIGLLPYELHNWMKRDEEFGQEMRQDKLSSTNKLSVEMHNLAQKGNYQALAFLLGRDSDSPYKDGMLKMSEQERQALEKIILLLAGQDGGLLPPSPVSKLTVSSTGINEESES